MKSTIVARNTDLCEKDVSEYHACQKSYGGESVIQIKQSLFFAHNIIMSHERDMIT